MNAKQPLPETILKQVRRLCVDLRYPAYVRLTPEGHIATWGGAWERYGLLALVPGAPAAEHIDLLVGLPLPPPNPITLPLLEVIPGVYADVSLFAEDDGIWVLLLDATDTARQRIQIQQYANEIALLREKENRLLAAISESHAKLLAVLNRLRIITAMVNRDDQVEFLSAIGRTIFDRDGTGVTGRPWQKVFPFDDDTLRQLRTAMADGTTGGERISAHLETGDGRQYWMEIDIQDDPRETGRRIVYMYDVTDVHDLRHLLDERARYHDMVGRSKPMRQVFQLIQDLAPMRVTVLVQGETGTGKELVARAIHYASPRKDAPFVTVNCAGLTDTLINSELFGHRKGAFTDAKNDQIGVFEAADGGTIFLDEIGDIPMNTQTRILRVLEEKEVVRTGETRARKIDIRILAATNKNLAEQVRLGIFREDLLYRIRVARIELPPLRRRREDIPLLVQAFLRVARASTGKQVDGVSAEALRLLTAYPWPGNVRELRNAVEFAVVRCKGVIIMPDDLPPEPLATATGQPTTRMTATDERNEILRALDETGGRRAEAAARLGISRATLYRRIKACFPNADPRSVGNHG